MTDSYYIPVWKVQPAHGAVEQTRERRRYLNAIRFCGRKTNSLVLRVTNWFRTLRARVREEDQCRRIANLLASVETVDEYRPFAQVLRIRGGILLIVTESSACSLLKFFPLPERDRSQRESFRHAKHV
jgi:hypothetical protein